MAYTPEMGDASGWNSMMPHKADPEFQCSHQRSGSLESSLTIDKPERRAHILLHQQGFCQSVRTGKALQSFKPT